MNEVRHIIIVEDDTAIQEVVSLILERKGYRITVFNHGEPLLNGSFDEPDLIILDRQLPGVDGLEICRHLKTQAATRHIPILILSASPQVGQPAKAAGADAFLEKPFTMQGLREMADQLLAPRGSG